MGAGVFLVLHCFFLHIARHSSLSNASRRAARILFGILLLTGVQPIAFAQSGEGLTTPPEPAIWSHLVSRFQIADRHHPRLLPHVLWYKNHPDYLERAFERARPFLHFILTEVERRGLPGELALLPVVESAFRPYAYSHGSAAGLWQFIPSTGRLYGLKINWWYDGRRDVAASTRAALEFLDDMHREFGDWPLALASYNTGAGNLKKRMKRNRDAGKPLDFWSLDLPNETEGYVPRLLALAQILEDRQRYGLTLPYIADRPVLLEVNAESQIDLTLAAELAQMELDALYELNPGYDRWATPPKGPHRFLLPIAVASRFRTQLDAVPARERVEWTRYVIQPGDSLGVIAQRFDTTPAAIRAANDLRGNLIRAGDPLMIRVARRDSSAYTQHAEAREERLLNRPRSGQRTIHEVQSGQSLWDIARNYRVTVKEVARWNGMAPKDVLRVGRELVVWVPDEPAPEIASPSAPEMPDVPLQKVRYQVRSGDNLSTIAVRFRTRVDDLIEQNQLNPDAYLQPGQWLEFEVDPRQSAR
jgi:membrane-bound lytic murein transglycosylase D